MRTSRGGLIVRAEAFGFYASPPARRLGSELDPGEAGTQETRAYPDESPSQMRRILNPMGTMDAIEFLIDKLRSTKTNAEFFASMQTGKN